jgi:hypothetical protein
LPTRTSRSLAELLLAALQDRRARFVILSLDLLQHPILPGEHYLRTCQEKRNKVGRGPAM